MTGLAHRLDELGKSLASLRVGASPASEYHLDLIIGHGAEMAIEGERDQRRQPLGNTRHAVDHDHEDRNDGGKRPGDNAPGMRMTAAAIVLEIPGACADFGLCRWIEHFKPRQWQARCAFEAKRALAVIDRAQVVVRPGGKCGAVFDDVEAVTKTYLYGVSAAARAVEVNCRPIPAIGWSRRD